MAKVALYYDKTGDVLYVRRRRVGKTLNFPLPGDKTICVNPGSVEVVGCIYEHLSSQHPRIYRALSEGKKSLRELVQEFFDSEFRDLNSLFDSMRSQKSLSNYLRRERPASRSKIPA